MHLQNGVYHHLQKESHPKLPQLSKVESRFNTTATGPEL